MTLTIHNMWPYITFGFCIGYYLQRDGKLWSDLFLFLSLLSLGDAESQAVPSIPAARWSLWGGGGVRLQRLTPQTLHAQRDLSHHLPTGWSASHHTPFQHAFIYAIFCQNWFIYITQVAHNDWDTLPVCPPATHSSFIVMPLECLSISVVAIVYFRGDMDLGWPLNHFLQFW